MKTPGKLRLILVAMAVVVAGGLWWCVRRARAEGSREASSSTLPTVAVAKVDREDLYREVTIPAEFRPYQEVELHAKVSGFVSEMKVDFGDRVKAGQLLATLEVPELSDDLHNAMAAVQKAEADHDGRPSRLHPPRLGSISSSPIWLPNRTSILPKQRIARQRPPSRPPKRTWRNTRQCWPIRKSPLRSMA